MFLPIAHIFSPTLTVNHLSCEWRTDILFRGLVVQEARSTSRFVRVRAHNQHIFLSQSLLFYSVFLVFWLMVSNNHIWDLEKCVDTYIPSNVIHEKYSGITQVLHVYLPTTRRYCKYQCKYVYTYEDLGSRTWGSRTWGSRTWGPRTSYLGSQSFSVSYRTLLLFLICDALEPT